MNQLAATIAKFFRESQLPVIFAGAGVSAHAGLPTWAGYLGQLAQHVKQYDPHTFHIMEGEINEGELESAAAYYNLCRKIPANEKWKLLGVPLDKYDSTQLIALAQLPATAYVTTNFDRSFLDAWAGTQKKAPLEANLGDPTLARAAFEERFFIARIHGRVEVPESICLTTQALEALLSNPDYIQLLTHVFTRRQVLFLGFSFLDPAIRRVLDIVTKHCGTFHHGHHLALLSSDAASDFIRELEAHSISRLTYDPISHHAALWSAIAEATNALRSAPPVIAAVRTEPFALAKRYLATAYARMRLGSKLTPLRQAINEGIVAGLIQQAGSNGISTFDLKTAVRTELTLDEGAAAEIVYGCVQLLTADNLCMWNNEKLVWQGNGENGYDAALRRLADGAMQRYSVREAGIESSEISSCLYEFFKQIVLQRGWDLGAAFAAHSLPERIDVEAMMRSIPCFAAIKKTTSSLARSVTDLLTKPDDEEAVLLAQLGRLAFGLELVLEAPHDAVFYEATLPERIYLDANVVMPAITAGHPHQKVFADAVDALQKAASTATIDVGIYVYGGFLNEIVSHRRLAIEAIGTESQEHIAELERQVRLSSTSNVNVFIGAFFNLRARAPKLTFREFLKKNAPYNDEKELRIHLQKLNYRVVGEGQLVGPTTDLPKILGLLDTAYADKLAYKRKSPVVVRHDAVQLAGLASDIRAGRRAIFVTADRTLPEAFAGTSFSWLGSAFVSHIGLTQLVDLLVGGQREARGLSSLLWGTQISADTTRIRDYLVDLALREHDAGMTKAMHVVVDDIAEDIELELERRELNLTGEGAQGREGLATLERYERDFYRKMRLAVERLDDKT